MVELGTGEYTYEVIEDWAKLPDGWSFKEAAAVGADSNDKVYVFSRGEHPMMVFDRDGNFLRSWGEGIFPRAHGITMGPETPSFAPTTGTIPFGNAPSMARYYSLWGSAVSPPNS